MRSVTGIPPRGGTGGGGGVTGTRSSGELGGPGGGGGGAGGGGGGAGAGGSAGAMSCSYHGAVERPNVAALVARLRCLCDSEEERFELTESVYEPKDYRSWTAEQVEKWAISVSPEAAVLKNVTGAQLDKLKREDFVNKGLSNPVINNLNYYLEQLKNKIVQTELHTVHTITPTPDCWHLKYVGTILTDRDPKVVIRNVVMTEASPNVDEFLKLMGMQLTWQFIRAGTKFYHPTGMTVTVSEIKRINGEPIFDGYFVELSLLATVDTRQLASEFLVSFASQLAPVCAMYNLSGVYPTAQPSLVPSSN
ncbi:mediator of RNA polymerase II transcription subunit 18 [Pelomyxa schiedti]|nr:mediator of RNA polymerase II transcription subunit 18 [Pelomyxa schiedti]